MALAHCDVKLELREILLKNRPQELLAISPKGTVPVLQLENGEIIDESIEIMEWVVKLKKSNWMDFDYKTQKELININDTKFVDSGAFSYTQPFLADRVYELDDEGGVKSEDATYLCTWLSGGVGKRGVWVDRYFYPDLASKEEALSSNDTYNVTYEQLVENLIMNNSSLKTSVEKKYIFDKKSDFVFQPNKRYRYERIKAKQ